MGIQEFRNLQLTKEAAGTLDDQRVDVGISGYRVFTRSPAFLVSYILINWYFGIFFLRIPNRFKG